MAKAVEDKARRIAEKGRETLIERLREAFAEAAAAHADVLELDEHKLEEMVARAAERADGLQWRRALAAAATEELGIGLGEALGHPTVARAQALVGAPSYEDGLAAIAEGKPPEPGSGATADEEGARASAARMETAGPAADDEPLAVRIAAVHIAGPPELNGEGQVTLVFSEDGLEVIRGSAGARLVHFPWRELERIEAQAGRRTMLRRRAAYPRVIIGATGGEARFEVEGVDADWLARRLVPAVARLGTKR
jgi:hypothetical protein